MASPALPELQRLFWESLARDPGGDAFAPELIATIEPSATLSPAERFAVYAQMYLWRLHGVLREDFPRTLALLGEKRFAALARDYVAAHPSTNPSVRHLGTRFAAFLAGRDDVPTALAELARLEWTRADVFDAPDAEPLAATALAAVAPDDWPGLRFRPIPALATIRSDWPVHTLWDATSLDDVQTVPTDVRVWRSPDLRVLHGPMDAYESRALAALVAGEPFAVICGAFGDLADEDAAREAIALLARWLEDGIIAAIA